MGSRTDHSQRRRRVLQAAGLAPLAISVPTAPAAPLAAFASADSHYLATIASRLDLLRPDLLRLGARLCDAVPATTLEPIFAEATRLIRDAVGQVLVSAEATVPGLVADDFGHGRVLAVEGIVFSHTEIALLGALSRERARAARG